MAQGCKCDSVLLLAQPAGRVLLDDDDTLLSKGKRKRKSKEGASVLAAQTIAAAINKPMPPELLQATVQEKKSYR